MNKDTTTDDDGIIHRSHSEAVRKRRGRASGDGIADSEDGAGEHHDPLQRVAPGLFGWDDPLDAVINPTAKFLSKPECLPILVAASSLITLGASAVLYYQTGKYAQKTCEEVASDPSHCGVGLPLLSYFGLEPPSSYAYLAGGATTTALMLVSLIYICSAYNFVVCKLELHRETEAIDTQTPYQPLPKGLRCTNMSQGILGVVAAACVVCQGAIGLDEPYTLLVQAAFVLFALLSLGCTALLQTRLHYAMPKLAASRTSAQETDTGTATADLAKQGATSGLPMRLQLKVGLAMLSLLCIVGCTVVYFELVGLTSAVRMWVLPMLQYMSLGFYVGAFCTYFQDIRTSGILWGDYAYCLKIKRLKRTTLNLDQPQHRPSLDAEQVSVHSNATLQPGGVGCEADAWEGAAGFAGYEFSSAISMCMPEVQQHDDNEMVPAVERDSDDLDSGSSGHGMSASGNGASKSGSTMVEASRPACGAVPSDCAVQ